MKRTVFTGLVAVAAIVLLLGPSSWFSAQSLPIPGAAGDGATVFAEFDTVVGLPDHSKVVVDGVEVGRVEGTRLRGESAVAELRVTPQTRICRTAAVELKQDTLLGDTYVAVTNPDCPAAARLAPGATLPRSAVRPPVQVEELMVSLANFLGSGALPQLGNTFASVLAQLPADPAEVRRAEAVAVDTLRAWADDTDGLNRMLTGLGGVVERLADMRGSLDYLLSPEGVHHMRTVTDASMILDLLVGVERTLRNALPAVPLLTAATRLIGEVTMPLAFPGWPNATIRDSNPARLLELLRESVIPALKQGPALDIRSIAVATGTSDRDLADQMVKAFRMLGMTR
ncbi:Mce family protein [Gordonia hirsuta DSM 44140 = NBRC 16056]|uniref:Mce family protein n=1 Tax=Gordonia hirsuta DSM 44140 = NBRC 16056 TaxID=1121927 RepID=L7LB86_9ACTN|nr:MlaD family protein [Gordonia hirsuta]GAC58400.1 Mce family protein [Gordonia hirsuta DSM 44140 = NBRC 16056]